MDKDNTQNNDYLPSFLMMVKVNYLWHIGDSYIASVKDLHNLKNNSHIYAIELLSTQAIENLLKSVVASKICVDNMNLDEQSLLCLIDKGFRSYGHRLDDLLNSQHDIKSFFGIECCYRENKTGFVDEYRIKFNDGVVLCFKNLEGIRYGAFASKSNVANGFQDSNKVVDFLENLSKKCSSILHDCSGILKPKI